VSTDGIGSTIWKPPIAANFVVASGPESLEASNAKKKEAIPAGMAAARNAANPKTQPSAKEPSAPLTPGMKGREIGLANSRMRTKAPLLPQQEIPKITRKTTDDLKSHFRNTTESLKTALPSGTLPPSLEAST
jgi:hypothetical protein